MITGFQNSHNMYRIERPMQVQTFQNGIVLPQVKTTEGPMWGLGGVCDSNNRFVELSAYDGGWATHGGAYAWEEEESCDCDVVYFGMFFNHWGHFLIDLMGRLWYFAQHHAEKPVKLAYIGEEEPIGNFLEMFELLGIAKEDLLHVTTPTRFRSVIVPEFSCRSCDWYSDEYRSIFDYMIEAVRKEGYVSERYADVEKVYFSRQAFRKAAMTEIGENAIVEWMNTNGFTAVAPETLSIREQIYLWNQASEIACLNGSIPMSIAFCGNKELRLTVLNKTHLEHLNLELYLLMRPCDVTLLDVWHEPFKAYPKTIGSGPFLFHLGEDVFAYSAQRGWVVPFTASQLVRMRFVNTLRLIWCILNIKVKVRLWLSKIVPTSLKTQLRRIRSHGNV